MKAGRPRKQKPWRPGAPAPIQAYDLSTGRFPWSTSHSAIARAAIRNSKMRTTDSWSCRSISVIVIFGS